MKPQDGTKPGPERPLRATSRGLLVSIAAPALVAGTLAATVVQPGGAAEPALPATGAEPVLGRAALARVSADLPEPARHPSATPGTAAKARPGTAAKARPAKPRWISIPAAGSDGPVDPTGERDGRLEIPPPGRAGWFAAGPRPGEPGRAVIVSHVDSLHGPALFAGLRTLRRGAKILVHDRRSRVHRFRVVRRRQVEKNRFRAASVYGGSARRELVLVTCGGPFRAGEGYRDNLILYARAVPAKRRHKGAAHGFGKARKRVIAGEPRSGHAR